MKNMASVTIRVEEILRVRKRGLPKHLEFCF